MHNREIAAAREYHERTKHSPRSVRESRHFLDWENQPLLFKTYEDIEPAVLAEGAAVRQAAALDALCRRSEPARLRPDAGDLGSLLQFSAGITRRRRYAGGEMWFRAAANTGALYEIELYLISTDVEGLRAGVYHYAPQDRGLRRLREGDFRGVLARATGQEPALVEAPATIVSTGTYWRNAWKYQARAYRHFGWDNGTLHANLLAIANARGIPARVVCGFCDDGVNRLLGLNTSREVALALVPLGTGSPAPPPAEVAELALRTRPLSKTEVDYPLMRAMHAASSLESPDEAALWRSAAVRPAPGVEPGGEVVPLVPPEPVPADAIEDVILRRGSSRRFERTPISFGAFSAILMGAGCALDADFLQPDAMLNEIYVIAHAVDGLRAGAYSYDRCAQQLEALRYGDFRKEAAFLALDQDLAGDAAAALFFLADLDSCLEPLGNRGYRAVQLEAGIRGGRAYLAAYALGLGATGLTFYDDEVTRFFMPHAAGKSAIFLVAVGHPARRQLPPRV
ncbi:MAG TPA: SagB family peptide dehydrogenase [Bryobacteraceae bacterium]|nr:SagB family peptide dehydrogenase [Bryobacteraceae bacterium]